MLNIIFWFFTIWFCFFWLFGLVDAMNKRSYLFIPTEIFEIHLSIKLRLILNVLFFPLYVLYHFIKRLIEILYEYVFEWIIVGVIRILLFIIKPIFHLIARIFN